MLAEWHNKPVGALYLLPLWHPVLLAEQIATLAAIAPADSLCNAVWVGSLAQSAGMGVDMTQRAAMLKQA